MQIFVYEYICGGGMAGMAPAESLQREGWAMLDVVLDDLGLCPGVQTVTLLDAGLHFTARSWPNNQSFFVNSGVEKKLFVEQARQADYTFVIAPEFDNLLLERCCWVKESGGRLLGSSLDAISLTADKLRLGERLRCHKVPTPVTHLWQGTMAAHTFPVVVKPRYGAGSQSTYLVRNEADHAAVCEAQAREGCTDEMIAQPFHDGLAASVAFLCGKGRTIVLPAAAQHISDEGRFRYQGGSVPLSSDLNGRAQRLASLAVKVVDGLSGYVGVDVVLGASADGRDDVVIEINTRLTTSYVGLRQLAKFNVAEVLLAVTRGTKLLPLCWNDGPIRFRADGIGT